MTRDDAVIGEAASLAMGLVMVGSRSETALEDMTNVREDFSQQTGWHACMHTYIDAYRVVSETKKKKTITVFPP